MPPDLTRMAPSVPCRANIRSRSTWAITLRAVLAWHTMRTVFTAPRTGTSKSAGPPREPATRRPGVGLLPELGARGLLEVAAERLPEDLGQLLRVPASDVLDVADGVGLSQEGVAEPGGGGDSGR